VLATLVAIFIWRGFVPAWKTVNSDFEDYYLAASAYFHTFLHMNNAAI